MWLLYIIRYNQSHIAYLKKTFTICCITFEFSYEGVCMLVTFIRLFLLINKTKENKQLNLKCFKLIFIIQCYSDIINTHSMKTRRTDRQTEDKDIRNLIKIHKTIFQYFFVCICNFKVFIRYLAKFKTSFDKV